MAHPSRRPLAFEDFTICLECRSRGPSGASEILVRVESSPMGSSGLAPWIPPEGIWQEATSLAASTASASCREIGRHLYDSLFEGARRELFLTSLAAVQGRGLGLRLRLKFRGSGLGRVTALPWETLYRSETRDFLCRTGQTAVVRHVDVRRPRWQRPALETLKILTLSSSPQGHEALDLEAELSSLRRTLGPLAGARLETVESPTLNGLRSAMRRLDPDILHIVAHGGLDPSGHGFLVLEEEAGGVGLMVSGEALAEHLKGARSLRLVVVNACDSGQHSTHGERIYEGVATALVLAGVPAVIGMQRAVYDTSAVLFSQAFYDALRDGDSLEAAMTEARLRLYSHSPSSAEWAIPVLFLAAPDGRVLQEPRPLPAAPRGETLGRPAAPTEAPPPSSETRFAELEAKIVDCLDLEDFGTALSLLDPLCSTPEVPPDAFFYRALGRLGGRRPRSVRLGLIRAIEADLKQAMLRCRGQEPAHLWLTMGLIKHDFYRLNGLRIPPPGIDDILNEVATASRVLEPLRVLQRSLKTPRNPVRQVLDQLASG